MRALATVGRIGISVAASRPETVYAVVDNQGLRPDSEPTDEEAPPGELTPRRLKTMTKELFAKLDDASLILLQPAGGYQGQTATSPVPRRRYDYIGNDQVGFVTNDPARAKEALQTVGTSR